MTDSYSGPYRATALWNEAVLLFRENMILKEHRHRFHKHKKSFTGYEAVTLMLNVLCLNLMFNPSISREQCCRLLRQFLKANLISPVKNCSLSNSKTTFYDSNKYLYEFTDQLVNFEPLQPISVSNINEQKTDHCRSTMGNQNDCDTMIDSSSIWKFTILKRVVELMTPFDVHKVTNFNDVNPSWVEINANPECFKRKWNSELPDWILSAIHDLIKYTSKDYCGTSYPNFQMDAFQVITDYFKTLEVPLIDQIYYDLYIAVYHHLEYLNCIEVVRSPKKNLQYESHFKIVSNSKKKNSSIFLPEQSLPPNHCYEAAFTSDDPTIRVVPQCSIDSIHLKRKTATHLEGMRAASSESGLENLGDTQISNSRIKFYHSGNNKTTRFKTSHMPLKSIDNFMNNHSNDLKNGIVNEGFLKCSPNNKRMYENEVPLSHKSDDCLNKRHELTREINHRDLNQLNNFVYVNQGLSFSLEDINLLAQDNLDYNYALESLNNLMKVTQHNQSMSDDDHSFHTALSQSEFELSDTESSSGHLHTRHACETEWEPGITELGNHIFQLLLMLLSPANRAKLKNLCVLLYKVSKNLPIPELTLQNMFLKLNGCILRSKSIEDSDHSTVQNILTFVVKNHKAVFAELPSDLLSNIKNELYEHQLKKITPCNKTTKEKLNMKKNEDSNSLTLLLDHILKNKNISEKERKKHLKLFKDCYPGIYQSRFPCESKSNKTKMLFSMKNLRL